MLFCEISFIRVALFKRINKKFDRFIDRFIKLNCFLKLYLKRNSTLGESVKAVNVINIGIVILDIVESLL